MRDLLPNPKHQDRKLNATCFGGGAAEIVGFAGFLKYLEDTSLPVKPRHESTGNLNGEAAEQNSIQVQDTPSQNTVEDELSQALQDTTISSLPQKPLLELNLLDIADWNKVIEKLHQGLTTPSSATSSPLLSSSTLISSFQALDVLFLPQSYFDEHYSSQPMLLTLLFTLNELYTASISKTTAFLLKLTIAVKKGTLLLVVDSPGSYSEAKVGNGEGKKYPMKWLMDHVLLDSGKSKNGSDEEDVEEVKWEKIMEDDSRWFRLPEGLQYPIPLENMRYQIHLYRRL